VIIGARSRDTRNDSVRSDLRRYTAHVPPNTSQPLSKALAGALWSLVGMNVLGRNYET